MPANENTASAAYSTIPGMADEPFYSAKYKPPPPRVARPGEPLWSVPVNGATWNAELRYHGEYGVEAQMFRQGELVIGRRFDAKRLAILWAKAERKVIERG